MMKNSFSPGLQPAAERRDVTARAHLLDARRHGVLAGRGPARVNTQPDSKMQATMSKAAFPEYVLPSGNTL